MDPASFTIGIVGTVIQVYGACSKAYDFFIEIQDFPEAYTNLRVALLIERYRLEQFKDHVLSISDEEKQRIQDSAKDRAFWKLFEFIFGKILETFNRSSQTMEQYGHKTGMPEQRNGADWELIDSLSLSLRSPPKHTLSRITARMKFNLWNKSKLESTIKDLKYWNDSLESMMEQRVQESSRRELRSEFSTDDVAQLKRLASAAKFLEHWDIHRMASARTLIEGFRQGHDDSVVELVPATAAQPASPAKFHFEMSDFEFQGNPFPSDINRATAMFQGEEVIIDWRCCEDDTWRIENPRAFRQRTEALTKVLNSDLKPLNLSVLHCLGYFDQNKHITGYAFRPPSGSISSEKPTTLQDALRNVESPDDVPDLGDRFDFAKALASTIFEIHNLGWIHKNIQPVNILFWPKKRRTPEPNVSKPYLMGFDISRPNQPGEITEKPPFRPEDDLYRHPEYKDREAVSFQPSFDIYSLGVVLWEVGTWSKIGGSRQRPSFGSPDAASFPDPNAIRKRINAGGLNQLKRLAGAKYRDAVQACFDPELDKIWQTPSRLDRASKLRAHLKLVRQGVVDVLASCNA